MISKAILTNQPPLFGGRLINDDGHGSEKLFFFFGSRETGNEERPMDIKTAGNKLPDLYRRDLSKRTKNYPVPSLFLSCTYSIVILFANIQDNFERDCD